ncbi:alpha/beta hydrolase fold [Dyadobacter soli]|uniref:Alpha/beta hydrolase fold n=1 Tax=Dyadobacter soli TaxID=659014 RepID=A0A1G6VPZ4_9BACT|nr:alpha/beta hydrolase [Dyadobacter soli]SDD55503.1 alpha/beta hydrolase fold [Dyadobacter soli]
MKVQSTIYAMIITLMYAIGPAFSQPFGTTAKHIDFQVLKFKPAIGDTVAYEYGFLKVPENRNAPETRSIELAVLRLKAKSPTSRSPILFLSGGPGQSGISYIQEEYFQSLIFNLQQDHDIILLDQRGAGRSTPSLEFPLPAADNKLIFLNEKRAIKLHNEAAAVGFADFKKRGIDIKGYNTVQNAEDLNDLRVALKIEKVNLLAYSYGTHLGLALARLHASSIDQMVLIGTSGPNHMHHLPFSYDKQLMRISALAAQDSVIKDQVPDMILLLKSQLKKLAANPVVLPVKDQRFKRVVHVPIGKFGLQLILRLDTGDSNDFVYFPAMLYGMEHGDYRILQRYVERRYNQFNGGYGSGISAMRQASGATADRYAEIIDQGKTAILGNSINTPDIYGGWQNIDLGDPFRTLFKCNLPTLFISGTLDSNTPVSNVEELLPWFSQARQLSVENAGHEDMLSNAEVQNEIMRFFRKMEPLKRSIALPKPRFVSFF